MRKIITKCSVWFAIVMVVSCSVFVPAFATTDSGEDSAVASYSVSEGLYYEAFEMFANFIYGSSSDLTGDQNLVLTVLATTAALFVVDLPFLIVYGFARMFMR